jgi:hypothetical protein
MNRVRREEDSGGSLPARRSRADEPHLRGKTLVAARAIWVVLVTTNLATFIAGVPGLFAAAKQVCPQGCSLVPQQQRALANIGISLQAYATLVIVFALVIALVSLAMGIFVFWRRSDDWMALIVALFLAVTATGNISAFSQPSGPSANSVLMNLIVLLLSLPLRATYYGTFLLFPSGRFVPRWSWILLVGWVVFIVVFDTLGNTFGYLAIGYLILYASAIACQIYRYRYVSNAVQRQQTKLVIVGFVGSLVANQIFWQTNSLQALQSTVYGPFTLLFYLLTLLVLPLCFFLAIQRYRLYEIDVLIRRTLVYGSLTVILAVIYLGGVVGLQTLLNATFRARSGESFSPPVIVVTTLLIAALFQPLRSRIQRAVDRRFYRSKFDAHRAIEQFGASLRQQVDLPNLTAQLILVVQETMEPAEISLWLSDTAAPPPNSVAEAR